MDKINNIKYAIDETYFKYPEAYKSISQVILGLSLQPIDYTKFTKTNGARQAVEGRITNEDVIAFVLMEVEKIYNAANYYYQNSQSIKDCFYEQDKIEKFYEVFPYNKVLSLRQKIEANQQNCISYFKENIIDLTDAINLVSETRYNEQWFYNRIGPSFKTLSSKSSGQFLDQYGGFKTYVTAKICSDLERERQKIYENVVINYETVNKCLNDIFNGTQLINKRNEYALNGELFATQDFGQKRGNQEDSLVIINHPEIPEFKFLAVSDGMGGVAYGEKASTYAIQEISKWFVSLPKESYHFPEHLQTEFNKKLNEINSVIYNTYNSSGQMLSGATFTGAIIADSVTVISSIGDSRAYCVDQNGISLATNDESLAWSINFSGLNSITDRDIDDLRFIKNNNVILRCLGFQDDLGYIRSSKIPNAYYDRLLILTDGVTDLLTTERIRILSQNTKKEDVTRLLIDEACLYAAIRPQGEDQFHSGMIEAGKDNASAVMYARR